MKASSSQKERGNKNPRGKGHPNEKKKVKDSETRGPQSVFSGKKSLPSDLALPLEKPGGI